MVTESGRSHRSATSPRPTVAAASPGAVSGAGPPGRARDRVGHGVGERVDAVEVEDG